MTTPSRAAHKLTVHLNWRVPKRGVFSAGFLKLALSNTKQGTIQKSVYSRSFWYHSDQDLITVNGAKSVIMKVGESKG